MDLAKICNWISVLSIYGLPLIEISYRKIAQREKEGNISSQLKNELILWKKSIGLSDPDELEYKYFLEGIEAIHSRSLEPADLNVPLSDRITIGDVVGASKRVKIYYLSRFGMLLSKFLINKQYHLYEATLFWLLIRSKTFDPLIQKVLSDHRVYKDAFQDTFIPSSDGISRALVKKWLKFFGLLKGNKIDPLKLCVMLLYASILEINEQFIQNKKWKKYVEEACHDLSSRFSISETVIDFATILECLYSRVSREILRGYPSGRGHRGLPSKPNIQILELSQPITLSSVNAEWVSDVTKAAIYR